MRLLIGISHTYPVGNPMLMSLTNLYLSRSTMQSSTRIYSWTFVTVFLLYINDMPQAVDYDLFLYENDTCLLFQDKDLERVKEELSKNFSNICDWFVGNKLNIHFPEDKAKSILFSTKSSKRKIGTLDIQYGDVRIKQYSKVTYLGYKLDESLSGEAMALKVIHKINGRLKLLYRKNRYLTP